MLIGEVARKTGVSAKALRLYETLGLLGRVERSGSYRRYSRHHLTMVQLIVQAKALGFKLADIQRIAQSGSSLETWSCVLQMMGGKVDELDRQIALLKAQKQALSSCQERIVACLAETPDCRFGESALDPALRDKL